MSTNLIVTVPKSKIQSLAHQGILICESFHQIRDLVRSHLGDACALLFAEPSIKKDNSAIDWYTPVQGTAKRLVDLPEEEQKAARAATVRMAQDIAGVAAELKQSGIASQVTRGTILELALRYPDENYIYVIGGHPLFTCWGFGPGTPGAQPQDLTRLGQAATPSKASLPKSDEAAPAAAVQPLIAQKTRGGFSWLWLLPFLLLCLLFFLLTGSFGGSVPLIPGFNFNGPALPFPQKTPDSPAETEREPSPTAETLRKEIETLEKRVLDRAEQCPAAAESSGTATSPRPQEDTLVIPSDRPGTMEFLRGRWLCDRGLLSKSDGQPIVVIYDFDSNGKGTATVRQNGREDCVGSAVGSMNAQGILVIEAERQVCPNGSGYAAETIECRRGADNRAMCSGKTGSGADWGGRVPFKRIY